MGTDYNANNLYLINVEENIELIVKILSKTTLINIKNSYDTVFFDDKLLIEYIQNVYDDGDGVIEIEIDKIKYNVPIIKLTEEHDLGINEGYYLSFFEDDLYELIPKPLLTSLNKCKLYPNEEKWVSWS